MSICAMALMGWAPQSTQVENLPLGILCALLCVCGWAVEVVICAYGMKDPNVNNEHALMIRQITSAIFYGVVIMNVIRGWNLVGDVLPTIATPVILASAFSGPPLICAIIRRSGILVRQREWLWISPIPSGPFRRLSCSPERCRMCAA